MTFKDRVLEIMRTKNLKQADICRLTEMSSSKVSQILSGKVKDPSLSTAVKIADALGVSLDYLAGRKPTQRPPSHADQRQRRLNECYEQMSDEGKENAVCTVSALLGAEKARVQVGAQAGVREAV